MSDATKIEWCDATFNPWIGCTKVSPGCAHCYAEGEDKRRGWTAEGWGKGRPRKRTSVSYWRQPLKWNRCVVGYDGTMFDESRGDIAPSGARRPRVFCASLGDVFDAEVDDAWRWDLIALINQTPNLDWLLLTKRPENAKRFLARVVNWPFPNVWLGTSVEDQARADERIPALLSIPAKVRFLSCEPLLGPIDLRGYTHLHWVIAGGESGHGARPMHPDWVRGLRDQCASAGAAFFFKQWGEWSSDSGHPGAERHWFNDGIMVRRLGKKIAGRQLDGREHSEWPA